MLKLNTRIDLNLQEFLAWWGGELAFLVPQAVAQTVRMGQGAPSAGTKK